MLEPYIVKKGGKEYVYRSTSHYSEEKRGPVADTEYMGVMVDGRLRPKKGYFYDEETGEFGPLDAELKKVEVPMVVSCKRYGDAYLLMALQERLGILEDLVKSFGARDGTMAMAVAMAYTIHPAALMHIEDTMERSCVPQLLGLPEDTDFSSQRMSELTKRIGADFAGLDEFFRRRIGTTNDQYIFDLTSESTYSSRNSNAEWGRNKDHMRLPQQNLGLVTDKVGHPLMFYLYPGSTADVATLQRMVDDVVRLGGAGAVLVMDRGFVSCRGAMYLLDNGMDFVMPMVMGDNPVVKSIVTSLLRFVGDVEHTFVHDGHSYTVLQTTVGIRVNRDENRTRRSTVWEDPDGYDMISEDDRDYGSADGYLDVFAYRDVRAAGCETEGMDVALNGIISDLKGRRPRDPAKLFAKSAGDYAGMLEWTMGEDGMEVTVKQNSHTFNTNRKGVFIMITPHERNRDWRQVLDCYACRDIIEDAFLEDKNEGDGRTPRSGDRDAIRGRTLIRMVSLIMQMEMIRRSSEYDADRKVRSDQKPRGLSKRTPGMLLASLSNLELIQGEGWSRMTELTKDNRLIFKMFDVGPPKGIDRS